MAVQAYINFNGNCREAVEYYSEVFGTEKPKIMLYGDTPPDPGFPLTEETKNLVMHTFLNIKGSMVMFSDVPPGMNLVVGNNISLVVSSKDMDEIKSVFNKLKVDGTVGMELQETFWSKYYGFVTDKFGIGWQLNYDSEQLGM
ncbi:MAG: glyoxalase [Peptococcaceae bacterium BICA1-7]|nr:MAG: glyoxalase [Peptococcaceae bacterium BICA1-7]HBV95873.1 VOC family protein [Desulfotomaculum sp.]